MEERVLDLNCRMYEQKYPEVDDLVMVSVKSISEMGAYVSLLEYGDIEGMILLSELSRRRIRSIPKLIRVGRQEVVVVLRVDKEKGYIDLSKRRVSGEDIIKFEEKYTKSKTVHSIMRHVAETTNVKLETLYEKWGWPLYKAYGHAYEAFKLAISDPVSAFKSVQIDDETKEVLLSIVKRRLTPQPIRFRADVEITCFSYDGIDAIKDAIRAGLAFDTPELPFKIKLVAAPLYDFVATALDKEKGIELLNQAIEKVHSVLKERGGALLVKTPPRAITEQDEQHMANLIKDAENQENSDEDEEGSGEEEENEK